MKSVRVWGGLTVCVAVLLIGLSGCKKDQPADSQQQSTVSKKDKGTDMVPEKRSLTW